MNDQIQSRYARKNWSSLMLFNILHPAHDALTLDVLNGVPGRDLHRFLWLQDDLIGSLDETWNWLEGHSGTKVTLPHAIHFTRGGPWMDDCDSVTYADLWNREFDLMKEAKS